MNNLAAVYFGTGKLDKAVPLFEEILKLRMAKLGADHPSSILSMSNLASGYRDTGKIDQALPLFQQAAAGMEKRNFKHEYAPRIINNLIDCHERLKQFDQAETWQRKWLAVVKERSGTNAIPYADELASLGLTLAKAKKWTETESVLRECLALREKLQPTVWTTYNTKSQLGGALLNQKKYGEAEPLLLAGYEGLKQQEKTIPAASKKHYTEALQRIIQLYTETNKPDEVKKWEAEKDIISKTPEKK
jgi:eukaryotic-like serine/threonine-protein kinase